MNASEYEGDAPRKSTRVQSSKRKAVSSPDSVDSSKRARTRQSVAAEQHRLQEEIDPLEGTINTPIKKSPRKPAKGAAGRASKFVNFKTDLEAKLDEELVANDLGLAAKVVLNLPSNLPAGNAVNPDTPTGSRQRPKTKAIRTQEKPKTDMSEEASKTTRKEVKQEAKEGEKEEEEPEDQVDRVSPNNGKRKRKQRSEGEEVKESLADEGAPNPTKRKRKTKQEQIEKEEEDEVREEGTPKKVKRKRKTKEEKEAEAMPLAVRTSSLRMYIGAHVSSAKGSSGPRSCAIISSTKTNISRSAKRGHQLCSYWVAYTQHHSLINTRG